MKAKNSLRATGAAQSSAGAIFLRRWVVISSRSVTLPVILRIQPVTVQEPSS